MKLFVLIVIFLMAKINFCDTQKELLLRKLKNFQDNDSNSKWNEIVANAVVNSGNNSERDAEDNSIWTKYLSQLLLLYKIHVYDKIKNIYGYTTDSPTNFDPNVSTKNPNDEKPNDSKTNEDPKTEIELLEPQYHGKFQETTTEVHALEVSERNTEHMECPEGFVKNNEGHCIDSKSSKLIIGVPQQCPVGYRRDRLGYCRKVF